MSRKQSEHEQICLNQFTRKALMRPGLARQSLRQWANLQYRCYDSTLANTSQPQSISPALANETSVPPAATSFPYPQGTTDYVHKAIVTGAQDIQLAPSPYSEAAKGVQHYETQALTETKLDVLNLEMDLFHQRFWEDNQTRYQAEFATFCQEKNIDVNDAEALQKAQDDFIPIWAKLNSPYMHSYNIAWWRRQIHSLYRSFLIWRGEKLRQIKWGHDIS